MEQNQTNYAQGALISVFARCLEVAKYKINNNQDLKNIQQILSKLKVGICFGYSIVYNNVGKNFTDINKYIIDGSNNNQYQEGYAKWLSLDVPEKIFKMFFGLPNEKK